jgi:hypothetical protein
MSAYTLLEVATNATSFPVSAIAVMVVGFIAAVSLGSVAWYNSKRPTGWADKERPNIVPNLDEVVPDVDK